MKLYLAVTADEYELPLIVEESLGEFASKLGKSSRTVINELNRIKRGKGSYNGAYCGYRMVKIEVDDWDDERRKKRERFPEACRLWKAGEITSVEAASICGMKRTTFQYRAERSGT